VFRHRDLPDPEPEEFGLAPHGGVSIVVFDRHTPSQPFRTVLWVADGAPAHVSDASVVMELRDPAGNAVARAAELVGTLTEGRLFELEIEMPDVVPARYVARLEINRPTRPPRVFEWPVEVPDPTLPVAAELEVSATRAAPGDTLELTVRNTGPTPIAFGETYEIERQREDGADWAFVPREGFDLMPLYTLEPGKSRALKVVVPRRARPGRHRIVKHIGSQWASATTRPTVEFDVVARTSE
jgi:hypothetical protein